MGIEPTIMIIWDIKMDQHVFFIPIGSMYGIYGNTYHQYTPNVSIYTIHGSYGIWAMMKYVTNDAAVFVDVQP